MVSDPTVRAEAAVQQAVGHLRQLGWLLGLSGLVLGLMLALGLLAGDSQGQVNLLYLIGLFVLWPLLALTGSLLFLATGRKAGASNLFSSLPLWPQEWRAALHLLSRRGLINAWLFSRSQGLALGFSAGILLGFLLMLLGTDISFVWRSTLLDAPDVLPVLEVLASPWSFWPGAQPSLELLQLTRDTRLSESSSGFIVYGQWWRYLLMAQLTYAIVPRCLLLLLGRYWFSRLTQPRLPSPLVKQRHSGLNRLPETEALAPPATAIEGKHVRLSIMELPDNLLAHLAAKIGEPCREINASKLYQLEQDGGLLEPDEHLLVVVNALEPPMGELEDFLRQYRGYLLPVSLRHGLWQTLKTEHLNEWRRFACQLPDWQVLKVEAPP